MDENVAKELAEGFQLMIDNALIDDVSVYVSKDIAGNTYVGIKYDSFIVYCYTAYSVMKEIYYCVNRAKKK